MPEDVPQNAGYMVAAYIVASVLLVSYAVSLFVRLRRFSRGSGAPPGPP
jgi:hypothetical protein